MDYSSTYRLAQDIRDSEEYRTYHDLKESVMADETTAALIKEYRKLQVTIQMTTLGGSSASDGRDERAAGGQRGYAAVFRHFRAAVLQGGGQPVPDGRDAAAAGAGGYLPDRDGSR